jgi:hypothetical protein
LEFGPVRSFKVAAFAYDLLVWADLKVGRDEMVIRKGHLITHLPFLDHHGQGWGGGRDINVGGRPACLKGVCVALV